MLTFIACSHVVSLRKKQIPSDMANILQQLKSLATKHALWNTKTWNNEVPQNTHKHIHRVQKTETDNTKQL